MYWNKNKEIGFYWIVSENHPPLDEIRINMFTELIKESDLIPKVIAKYISVTVPNNSGVNEREFHGTISVMSHIIKSITRILCKAEGNRKKDKKGAELS